MSDQPDAIQALTERRPSPGEQFFPAFKVTPALEKKAKELVALYPEGKEQSAVLPIIHLIQEKFGYISPESIPWIAEMCLCTPIHVEGVVTFYPGIRRMCPGKWHIRVCHTIACALSGAEELLPYICEKTGINPADMTEEEPIAVSPDGVWSLEAVECLANCGFGPNIMINDTLYSQVDKAMVDKLVADYSKKVKS
ncbi:MAG: NAD(P)H-dependent oxidoreductase subunit E [Akkermansiaceae bacterium]|nr:NAD(P)H-dependent oxidoreductase subunit E [Akkermansiaceae bacterium]